MVLIAEEGREGVPVAKVMDFGKALYEKKKKQHEAKKHQKVIQIKEIKIAPKIGEHDFQTKMRQAMEFLKEGKRVKITCSSRGVRMPLGRSGELSCLIKYSKFLKSMICLRIWTKNLIENGLIVVSHLFFKKC